MAKLRYVDDDTPGITRKKLKNGWAYFRPDGERITDREEIDRLNKIALPPAYAEAWYSPYANGHLLAIGYDEKGRKQYRYHEDFRAAQEAEKYERLAEFGRALPKIRARVEADLRKTSIGKDRAVAAIVRLLDLGKIRVGNESYAKENKSFGATTLRNRHASVAGATLKLSYKAKSGKMCVMRVTDGSLARFVKRVQDLPGQNLFQYLDEDGTPQPVDSSDVNDYLRDASGGEFTAKDFRTWGASTIAFAVLHHTEGKTDLKTLLDPVSEALGNTPAIARKSYVHPALVAMAGPKGERWAHKTLPRSAKHMSRAERGLIGFLDALEPKDLAA